eukprot:5059872-Pyramimonas_sp.AAC.1
MYRRDATTPPINIARQHNHQAPLQVPTPVHGGSATWAVLQHADGRSKPRQHGLQTPHYALNLQPCSRGRKQPHHDYDRLEI